MLAVIVATGNRAACKLAWHRYQSQAGRPGRRNTFMHGGWLGVLRACILMLVAAVVQWID